MQISEHEPLPKNIYMFRRKKSQANRKRLVNCVKRCITPGTLCINTSRLMKIYCRLNIPGMREGRGCGKGEEDGEEQEERGKEAGTGGLGQRRRKESEGERKILRKNRSGRAEVEEREV